MTSVSLTTWRRRFKSQQDDCPWPGPRPLGSEEARGTVSVHPEALQLRGRNLEVSDLAMACLSNHLVVIHGQSGVGKSRSSTSDSSPVESLGKTVIYERTGDPQEMPSRRSSCLSLRSQRSSTATIRRGVGSDRRYQISSSSSSTSSRSPSAVIGFAHRVLRWIEEVVGKIAFVISLRSEFEHQFPGPAHRPFTKRARSR